MPAIHHEELMKNLESVLSPLLDGEGYELWALELKKQRGRLYLVVYLDSQEGITLADCEKASAIIESALEKEDPFAGAYNLEVSSPGLERVLVKPEHFQRFVGEKVKVKVKSDRFNRKNFSGKITQADERKVSLLDNEGTSFSFFYEEINKAHLWCPLIPKSKGGER